MGWRGKYSNHSPGKNMSPNLKKKRMPQSIPGGREHIYQPSLLLQKPLSSLFTALSRSQFLQSHTKTLPDLSCFILPLLALGSTGRKSLNQVISGSGFPLAAQSIVAVRVLSTTFSWGPISMFGKPGGNWSSGGREQRRSG